MATRAMGTGTISFGLVNIPVKVYSANESGGKIGFNQLHAEKKTRLKQQLYDPETGEIVPRDKVVKGYEYAKDQYVVFTEAELDALELATTKAMEISEFVPLASIDPLYFETGYYLGPDKGAERAFSLLGAALKETQQGAVAKYVARGKQNLILLRPLGRGLVMQQLRYEDEVKAQSELDLPETPVTEAELGLARQIIAGLAKPTFDAKQYRDEYREKLKELIDRKVKGETVTISAAPQPVAKVVDLMEALKASLARSSGAPSTASPAPAPEEVERKGPQKAPRAETAAPKKARGGKK